MEEEIKRSKSCEKMVAVSPVKGRFFSSFFSPLIRMGRYFGFSVANLREGKFGTRGREEWHILGFIWYLFSFFFHLSFYMRYYIKLIILVYVQ